MPQFPAVFELSTLNGTNGFRLDGIDAGDVSGFSVSSAGDVNGDGFDDILIGARLGDPGGNDYAGESYVVFGKASGFTASFDLASLDGSNGFRLDGIDASDASGFSVSGAGDVNGDGFDDILIGARLADPGGNSDAGESYVVFGKASGFAASFDLAALDGANGFRLDGIDAGDDSGRSVSGAGDVNGDGFDDILIGAHLADPGGDSAAGEAYVVFGKASGFAASLDLTALDGANGFRLDGIDAGDFSGLTVASAGDVNGDGFDDIMIGAAQANPGGDAEAGESYVVFGKASGFAAAFDLSALDGANGFRLDGIDAGDHSGFPLSSAGDVNGDGFDDIVIGATGGDPGGDSSAGESYVVFGKASGFAAAFDLASLDGANGFRIDGIDGSDFSGWSVSSAGDFNGDGFDDILIGAFGGDPGGAANAGESYVVFGKTSGFAAALDLAALDGDNGFRLDGVDAGDQSGYSASAAGDVNGDGFDDILIGAFHSAAGGGSDAGVSYVVFGHAGNAAPAVTGPVTGAATEDGAAVTLDALANASDIDGDTLSVINVQAVLPPGVTFGGHALGLSDITGISIPVGSNDAGSHPLNDNVWSVSANPGPVDVNSGIGYLVNPANPTDQFTLHDHIYIAPNVPDPSRAVITFQFAAPTVVEQLDVVEHTNGVTGLHVYAGNSLNSLTDIGVVFGSLGDLTGPSQMSEGALNVFDLNNSVAGTYLQVVIDKTSLSDGYAFYRMFPSGVVGSVNGFTLDPSNPAYQYLAAGEQTTVTVTYDVSDGTVSTPGSASWTVTGVNDAPALTGAAATLAAGSEDTPYLISASDLLAGFTDAEGDTMSVSGLTADHGNLVNNNDATWTFTPAANYNGLVSLSYNVDDGTGGSTTTSQSFNLAAVNDAPTVTGPVTGAATEDGVAVTLDALANASDIDGDTLSVINVQAVLPPGVTFGSHALGLSDIAGISIPVGSNDAGSHPLNDNVWSVSANPGPVDVNSGIGYLVNPANPTDQFTLHDHIYIAPNVPDPSRAVITFQFAAPTVVEQLDVVEHTNGVTGLHVYAGNSLNSLTDIGVVFGSLGDLTGPSQMSEGALNVFDLNNSVAGTYLQVVIDKTSLSDGYAFYRMFPSGVVGSVNGFTLDPSNPAYQYLAAGEQTTVTVTYDVSDGTVSTPGSASWTVTGVNDAPAITSNGGGTTASVLLAENVSAVTTVTAADPDTGAILGYSIIGGADAARFAIDPNSGALSFVTAPDFEAPADAGADNVYDIEVQVSDGQGGLDSQAIAVTVTNISGVTINGTGAANTVNATQTVAGQPLPTNEEDSIFGLGGTDNLSGLGGNDTLNGGTGADTLIGGAGNDTYVVDNAGDVVTESVNEGTDAVQSSVTYTLAANVENLTLTGNGNTRATGNAGANSLIGNTGNNILDGASDADTLAGGTGNDTYVIDNAGDVVSEAASAGTDLVQASITYSLAAFANVENLTLTGTGNIDATGNDAANRLTGNTGNNILDGAGGADRLIGGTGNDNYVIDSAGIVVTEGAGAGTDQVLASITYALANNVENLTLTGNGNINGTGNTLANILTGNGGDNSLNGLSGADTLIGGAGNDTYVVDNTGDVVTEIANEGTDSVQSSITYTLTVNVENLTLTGGASIGATGNAGANSLTGNTGSNILDGAGGADTLTGGTGNDTYFVDDAGDVVNEAAGAGTDLVQASISYTLAVNVENLTLTGVSNIDGVGNGLNNMILGNAGDNILTGGAGVDTMTGGAGDDTFDFNLIGETGVTAATRDRIADFGAGTDHIDLADIDANVGLAADQAFSFIGAAAFSGAAGQLRAILSGGNTIVEGDVTGDGVRDFQIQLNGTHTLAAADFLL